MREILFRGKRGDNGEWIEGQLMHFKASVGSDELAVILCGCEWDHSGEWFSLGKHFRVIPETVGQYTGLTDKNGKKIFEGDIVYDTIDRENALIVFENGSYYVKNYCIFMRLGESASVQIEVIGNVHDNLELLKGGAE